ncbi:hypothetical protein QQP08_015193 [Theobroma cacao]|nr:hypothetical protein QQP08_015193 [Theobroma cacao]
MLLPDGESIYGNGCIFHGGIKVDIHEDEVEWLRRSTTGRLRRATNCQQIQSILANDGVIGGLDVILSFGERKELEAVLAKQMVIFEKWFEEIQSYVLNEDRRKNSV